MVFCGLKVNSDISLMLKYPHMRHLIRVIRRVRGFTLVEMIIAVALIGILATIGIVAYNGVQNRARNAKASSAVKSASDALGIYVGKNRACPSILADVSVVNTPSVKYHYYCSNNGVLPYYCVTAVVDDRSYYYMDSNASPTPQEGVCKEYNFAAWNKPSTPSSVPAAAVDTSTYYSSTASVRIGTGQNLEVKGSPVSVAASQQVSVSFYMKTESTWNGGGNSKVRMYDAAGGGTLLYSCLYNGVKTSWTLITCNYTVASGVTRVGITLWNDGTVGNIWIDELIVKRSY